MALDERKRLDLRRAVIFESHINLGCKDVDLSCIHIDVSLCRRGSTDVAFIAYTLTIPASRQQVQE